MSCYGLSVILNVISLLSVKPRPNPSAGKVVEIRFYRSILTFKITEFLAITTPTTSHYILLDSRGKIKTALRQLTFKLIVFTRQEKTTKNN